MQATPLSNPAFLEFTLQALTHTHNYRVKNAWKLLGLYDEDVVTTGEVASGVERKQC